MPSPCKQEEKPCRSSQRKADHVLMTPWNRLSTCRPIFFVKWPWSEHECFSFKTWVWVGFLSSFSFTGCSCRKVKGVLSSFFKPMVSSEGNKEKAEYTAKTEQTKEARTLQLMWSLSAELWSKPKKKHPKKQVNLEIKQQLPSFTTSSFESKNNLNHIKETNSSCRF